MPFTLVSRWKIQDRWQIKIQTIHKLNTTQRKQITQNTAKQNYLVQSPFMTLGQETRWAYSTALPSPHRACFLVFSLKGKWWILSMTSTLWTVTCRLRSIVVCVSPWQPCYSEWCMNSHHRSAQSVTLTLAKWFNDQTAVKRHNLGRHFFTANRIVQCFTSPPTQYRLYGRRFLQVKRPS